ncbi:MAG: hypothetical protein ABJB33_01180 [Gemmatimonadota bacterium]
MILALLGGCLLSGCLAHTTYAPTNTTLWTEEAPRAVRVYLVNDPIPKRIGQFKVTPDSVFGIIEGSALPGHPLQRLAVSVDSVDRITVTKVDVIRTLLIPLVPLIIGFNVVGTFAE